MRIVLLNAPLRSTVCDCVTGHQIPLGLLMLGGPLLDAGHEVTLVDAARERMSDAAIVAAAQGADVLMVSHVGSTQAHPCCLRVMRAIKAAALDTITVYGGVYPTYHARRILAESPEVDIIVRGEGEATALELVQAIARQRADASAPLNLSSVPGLWWRHDGKLEQTAARQPIEDLDAYRIGWELITDWDRYQAFGMGRAAVVQFSRGCPHTCTFCGQWMFWKRWRHRDPVRFVDELEWLHREHDIQYFWLADENPTTERDTWRMVLEEIVRRGLAIGLSATVRAEDIVRDADLLPLYKQAGFIYTLLGVETMTDEVMVQIRKGSCVDDAYQAVRLQREHGIASIVDYIVGFEQETPRTLWRAFKGLCRYEPDMANVLYLLPHAWTPLGHAMKGTPVVDPDMEHWDYRHQVLAVKHMSPTLLLMAVKLLEAAYHLHPRQLWRIARQRDPQVRQLMFWCMRRAPRWFLREIADHLAATRTSRRT